MFYEKKLASDPFYLRIKRDQIELYQKYLGALFSVIDIDNCTLWTKSSYYDKAKLARDIRIIAKVSNDLGASHGLCPEFLQTMIYQYFFADFWLRKPYKSTWAKTVVYKKANRRFFPAAQSVQRFLEVGLRIPAPVGGQTAGQSCPAEAQKILHRTAA
jgi:hypothetical protein